MLDFESTALVEQIYKLIGLNGPLHEEFHQSPRCNSLAGALNFKKALTTEQIDNLLPGSSPVDLERYLFAVDQFLLLNAIHSIRIALPHVDLRNVQRAEVQLGLRAERLVQSVGPAAVTGVQHLTERIIAPYLTSDKEGFRDIFQALRMSLVPREIRHALGAFYTPQWMAGHVLRSSGFGGLKNLSAQKVLDPSAGSGVFLVAAAEEIRKAVIERSLTAEEAKKALTSNLMAIEIEAVPCLQTTANLTLCLRKLSQQDLETKSFPNFPVICGDSLEPQPSIPPADFVVGNPPWVNWEYMPPSFKVKHAHLWPELNLYSRKETTMSFSKEDISALFVANSVANHLTSSGRFAFILPESLIKSTKNHTGFRKFEVGIFAEPYSITRAEDFVKVRPFERVNNRTIVLYGQKSESTEYPIPLRRWTNVMPESKDLSSPQQIHGAYEDLYAQPCDSRDPTSAWSTGPLDQLSTFRLLEGDNAYRGRTGVFTGGANAVFHLKPLGITSKGLLKVENVIGRAKRSAPVVQAELENEYIFPFMRGRDLQQWSSSVQIATVLPHSAETRMHPIDETTLVQSAPNTLEYFRKFEDVLAERKGFSSWESAYRESGFYACQRVGTYTFSDWKVGWRYISKSFTTDIIGPLDCFGLGVKPVIPNEKIIYVACESEDEAFFLGGVFATSLVRKQVESRMISTQVSPGIVSGLQIPKFDPTKPSHLAIVDACKHAYALKYSHRDQFSRALFDMELQVGQLWDIRPETVSDLFEPFLPKLPTLER